MGLAHLQCKHSALPRPPSELDENSHRHAQHRDDVLQLRPPRPKRPHFKAVPGNRGKVTALRCPLAAAAHLLCISSSERRGCCTQERQLTNDDGAVLQGVPCCLSQQRPIGGFERWPTVLRESVPLFLLLLLFSPCDVEFCRYYKHLQRFRDKHI